MKLVNMKQEPESAVASPHQALKPDQPAYPYGLRIRLNHKDLTKLGIKDLPKVGSYMKLTAEVEVCEISMNESTFYGDNKNMELQITDMGLSAKKDEDKE